MSVAEQQEKYPMREGWKARIEAQIAAREAASADAPLTDWEAQVGPTVYFDVHKAQLRRDLPGACPGELLAEAKQRYGKLTLEVQRQYLDSDELEKLKADAAAADTPMNREHLRRLRSSLVDTLKDGVLRLEAASLWTGYSRQCSC